VFCIPGEIVPTLGQGATLVNGADFGLDVAMNDCSIFFALQGLILFFRSV
jgi:hypothetical protein